MHGELGVRSGQDEAGGHADDDVADQVQWSHDRHGSVDPV